MSLFIKGFHSVLVNAANINQISFLPYSETLFRVYALMQSRGDQVLFEGLEEECIAFIGELEDYLNTDTIPFRFNPKPTPVPEPLEESDFPQPIEESDFPQPIEESDFPQPLEESDFPREDYEVTYDREEKNQKLETFSMVALAGLLASGKTDPVEEAIATGMAVFAKLELLKKEHKA